jgi:hypothetical protein
MIGLPAVFPQGGEQVVSGAFPGSRSGQKGRDFSDSPPTSLLKRNLRIASHSTRPTGPALTQSGAILRDFDWVPRLPELFAAKSVRLHTTASFLREAL